MTKLMSETTLKFSSHSAYIQSQNKNILFIEITLFIIKRKILKSKQRS